MLKHSIKFLAILSIIVIGWSLVFAAPTDIDTGFGTNGIITINNGEGDYSFRIGYQPDGKLLISNYVLNFSGQPPNRMFMYRFNVNGTPDTSFDTDGKLDLWSLVPDIWPMQSHTMADGKILITGSQTVGQNLENFYIMRLNANGSLDTSFGTGGKVLHTITGSTLIQEVIILPSGKLLLATTQSPDFDDSVILARFNADGSLDTNFGTGGTQTFLGDGAPSFRKLFVQSDGKIIVVAEEIDMNVYIARFNEDGSVDMGYGTGGYTSYSADRGSSAVMLPDHKVVVVAHDEGSPDSHFLLRFDTSGELDTTFDTDGRVDFTYDGTSSLALVGLRLQADNKMLGYSYIGTTNSDLVLMRFNPDGSFDTSFGTNGKFAYNIGTDDQSGDLFIQPDGKFVVSAYANMNILLLRFNGDSLAPQETPTNTPESATATVTAEAPTATATSELSTATSTPDVPTATATSELSTATHTPESPTATFTAEPLGTELLIDGGFEIDAAAPFKLPDHWTLTGKSMDKLKCNTDTVIVAFEGVCAFVFKGVAGENAKLTQKLDVTLPTFAANDTLTMSVQYQTGNSAPRLKVKVRVFYVDTTLTIGKLNQTITTVSSGIYSPVTLPAYALTDAGVSKIKVQFQNRATSGKITIDAASLMLNQ